MKRYEIPSDSQRLTLESFVVPPYPMKGDSDVNELYRAIGRSLSQWEMIEIALARLFSSLLHPEQSFILAAGAATQHVFGTLASARARIDVIRESAVTVLQTLAMNDLADGVTNHLKVVERASQRRNEIAHGLASHFEKYGHVLVPHMHNPRKMVREPKNLDTLWKYKYSSTEIDAFSERFTLLFKETWNLSLDVSDELRTFVDTHRGRSSRRLED